MGSQGIHVQSNFLNSKRVEYVERVFLFGPVKKLLHLHPENIGQHNVENPSTKLRMQQSPL